MARKRRTDSHSAPTSSASSMPTPRRRAAVLRDLHASAVSDGDAVVPKVINAAPSLEKAEMYGIDDPRPTSSRIMALAGRLIIETIPQGLAAAGMLALIFGGCCSNVCSLLPCFEWAMLTILTGLCTRGHCQVSWGCTVSYILHDTMLTCLLQS